MIQAINKLDIFLHRHWSKQVVRFYHGKNISNPSFRGSPWHILTLKVKHARDSFPWSYSRCLKLYSSTKQSPVFELAQEIDTEELKEKCRRHLLMTGVEIDAEDLVHKQLKVDLDQTIKNLNERDKRTLKILQLEHDFLYSQGYDIPSPDEMTNENWLHVMTVSTLEDRFMYYTSIKDVLEQQASTERLSKVDDPVSQERAHDCQNGIIYDCENSEREMRWGNNRLASAMQFGIPLVIDMDFVDLNSATELVPLSQQLYDMYCINRASPEPFHLLFTSCPPSNPIYRHLMLHQMIKTPYVLATFTEKSYLDLFSSNELVYLSAQSKERMRDFNPDAVYILGAYYDPLVRKKGSYIKAKEHKLKCLRLPITENVRWRHQASKDLDMNHVVAVLHSAKAKQPWKEALVSNLPMLVNLET